MSDFEIRGIEDWEDVEDILEIIDDHDEDDGRYARQYYRHWLDKQSETHRDLVLEVDDEIVAVSGFSWDENTDGTFWLSWTYTDYDYHGRGYGTEVTLECFNLMEEVEGRKIYVSTSDYVDPEDGTSYERALNFYRSLGFREEMVARDYYQPGESRIILSRGLSRYNRRHGKKASVDRKTSFSIAGVEPTPETEDLYYLLWQFDDTPRDDRKDQFQQTLDQLRAKRARGLYATCSSIDNQPSRFFLSRKFDDRGKLVDYFEDGQHELHYYLDLKK